MKENCQKAFQSSSSDFHQQFMRIFPCTNLVSCFVCLSLIAFLSCVYELFLFSLLWVSHLQPLLLFLDDLLLIDVILSPTSCQAQLCSQFLDVSCRKYLLLVCSLSFIFVLDKVMLTFGVWCFKAFASQLKLSFPVSPTNGDVFFPAIYGYSQQYSQL